MKRIATCWASALLLTATACGDDGGVSPGSGGAASAGGIASGASGVQASGTAASGQGGDDATSGATTPDASSAASQGVGAGDLGGGPPAGDPPSNGGTITFTSIGAPGWYPSRRDPEVGPCDARDEGECCLGTHEVAGDALTPWDEDLIMTLRGPMQVADFAVYQPTGDAGDPWGLVSRWHRSQPSVETGIDFRGNGTEEAGFDGTVGTECLVDVSTSQPFACGPGSDPFCPPSNTGARLGWAGSKMFVLLATMPHADEVGARCSDDDTGNWFDAPWIGLSHGELVRAGAFSPCQCYAKNPDEWWLADGCGQFNVLEVVNDNNEYANLGVFSTNFFGYAGYVGEGPCGAACDVSVLADDVDLIDKSSNTEAATGAEASPDQGPGAAFRRPDRGYRYFVILLDVATRTVQLAIVHPDQVPAAAADLLPAIPAAVDGAVVDAVRGMRLPQ